MCKLKSAFPYNTYAINIVETSGQDLPPGHLHVNHQVEVEFIIQMVLTS